MFRSQFTNFPSQPTSYYNDQGRDIHLLNIRAGDVKKPLVTPSFSRKNLPRLQRLRLVTCISTYHDTDTRLKLREWLSKTAKCLLSFQLTTTESWDYWTSHPPREILALFASISVQWKEVDLTTKFVLTPYPQIPYLFLPRLPFV
jgi:hypothetical protein